MSKALRGFRMVWLKFHFLQETLSENKSNLLPNIVNHDVSHLNMSGMQTFGYKCVCGITSGWDHEVCAQKEVSSAV